MLAGNGAEGLADGPARTAAMAQPSGLASENGRLWVVDSETSSLRHLDRSGRLHTVVGTGLFDFGHRDGPAQRALLQHPLGVVVTPEGPVVCDTYNSALRRYDERAQTLSTLARDGLDEPSGALSSEGASSSPTLTTTASPAWTRAARSERSASGAFRRRRCERNRGRSHARSARSSSPTT